MESKALHLHYFVSPGLAYLFFNNRKPKSYEMNKPQAEECAVPLHLLPISLNAGKEKVSVNI